MGFGVWEDLQSIGNGCGLQMDGFSAHFEPYRSIFDDFQDFRYFAIVSVGLTLFPEGPRNLRECSEGPCTEWKQTIAFGDLGESPIFGKNLGIRAKAQ